MKRLRRHLAQAGFAVAVLVGAVAGVQAGEPSVLDVTVTANANGTYAFQVTVFHKDEGWDHYANAFDIMIGDGTSVGTRVLYHPHVDEQPFTRSLSSVAIPIGVTEVTVVARDTQHGEGTRTMTVKLPRRK